MRHDPEARSAQAYRNSPVARARARKLWTQHKLAAIAEVNVTTVYRAERGQRISLLSQERIAQALGVPVEKLFPPEPEEQAS